MSQRVTATTASRRTRSIATLVAGMLTIGCGGQSSTTPTSPGASAQNCRTYATSSRAVQTGVLGAERADLWELASTCRWSGDRLTCAQQYSRFSGDCAGQPGGATWTATYASAADFVDEASVVPPASKATSITVTSVAGLCPSPSESRLQYDGSGRLLRIVSGSPSNLAGNSTKAFTAWDSRGRPTDGTFANFRVSGPVAIRHDEAARTTTEVGTYDGGNWVITTTTGYDANGNVVREVFSDVVSGDRPRATYTTTTTILATDRVCK